MAEPSARRLFALDHNFPQPIVEVLAAYIVEAELIPLQEIDPRLPEFEDDWKILLALHHHERRWDGLITTDSSMVSLPRELSVLLQTKLTLVVAQEAGHDPVKATGLVLAYLPGICERTRRDVAQLWRLHAVNRPGEDPWEQLRRVAEHQGRPPSELYDEGKLTHKQLAENPLSFGPRQ